MLNQVQERVLSERANVAGVMHGDHVVWLATGWHGVVVDLRGDEDGAGGWVRVNWMHDPHHLLGDIFKHEEIKARWFLSGDDKIKWEFGP